MEDKKTYLEEQIDAVMNENEGYTFTFQREKIKLLDGLEATMIKEADPAFEKKIELTDDELLVTIHPPSTYQNYRILKRKDKKSKWRFAYQLVKKVQEHSMERLHLIIAPENIVFDHSLTPAFLHYGVTESIPPYETDHNRLMNEMKALIALSVDEKYPFHDYLKYYETLKLSETAKEILSKKNETELLEYIKEKIEEIEAEEKLLLHIPKKKWSMQKYIGIGLIVLLVPALIYSFYSLFFAIPRQEAYVESNRLFLNNQYSEVINELSKYDERSMPQGVQYQLARSYIVTASLTEEQRGNIENTLTLQADPQYFMYWINIGRGKNKEAIDIARMLEDRDLIAYGLINYQKEIMASSELDSQEKEQQVKQIEGELQEYRNELEEQKTEGEQSDGAQDSGAENQQDSGNNN
ncbi:type VII secretion protein EssB [Bacillus gobiensis]|uniref:type VII secretion protein EssB n=1 Tax=Bacillus gobiensis TaxID=1441095 RepID=UPI003D25C89C